jgi:hypothetical protein
MSGQFSELVNRGWSQLPQDESEKYFFPNKLLTPLQAERSGIPMKFGIYPRGISPRKKTSLNQ